MMEPEEFVQALCFAAVPAGKELLMAKLKKRLTPYLFRIGLK